MILHVVTAQSHAAGVPDNRPGLAEWDLRAAIIKQAQDQGDPSLRQALDGLTIHCKLVTGDVALAIVQTAQDEKADLIMMPSYSFTFYQFPEHGVSSGAIAATPHAKLELLWQHY